MIRHLLLNPNNQKKTAVIDGKKTITYHDLTQRALALHPHLPKNLTTHIVIFLPNSIDYIATLFGTFMFGITAFPLNTHMTKHELLPLLKQVSTHTVITNNVFKEMFDEIKMYHIPNLQIICTDDLSSDNNKLPVIVSAESEKPAILLTTSGSTGKVRIVPLTETNIETSALGYLDKMNFDKKNLSEVRYILATPFSTAYGLMILSACLIKSFPLILLQEDFTLNSFYRTVWEHKATHYEGGTAVPLLMEQTTGRPIPYDISSLKNFGFGGSKISGNTLKRLLDTYPLTRFWQGYGMTEASPLITKYANMDALKLESVGTPINGVHVAVEADGIITTAPYVTGEIIVQGANIMSGYYENKAETNKVLKNGYLYTGDIGYLDIDGYLYICGRKKNVIIVRGLNVYPEEVEACILNSLLAKDCAVYGKPNDSGNETVCADVIPLNPQIQPDAIKTYCHLHLSDYKQPLNIQFVKVIKRLPSGKIKRSARDKS